jgi:predicted transcriptional regulator
MSEQRQVILSALEESGEVAFKDLQQMTGMEYNNLLKLIHKLKKQGAIESPSKGVYRLAQKHDQHEQKHDHPA